MYLNLFDADSCIVTGRDMKSRNQSHRRARYWDDVVGRADHHPLFSPSVGVWGKIHYYGCHSSGRFSPHNGE
ncbi:hypothetical protein TNCV_1690961 [Trichonephila clavipes]|nr:hypothetical protein TNCV_1690961 [Trichonephila clavipes]